MAKRKAKLTDEQRKHRLALANYDAECKEAKEEAWMSHVNRATLDVCTGRVLAVGYGLSFKGQEPKLFLDVSEDEHGLLSRFWGLAACAKKRGGKLVSFNGHGFDIPFMVSRSWAYDDVVPLNLLTKYNKYEDFCIDTAITYRQGPLRLLWRHQAG